MDSNSAQTTQPEPAINFQKPEAGRQPTTSQSQPLHQAQLDPEAHRSQQPSTQNQAQTEATKPPASGQQHTPPPKSDQTNQQPAYSVPEFKIEDSRVAPGWKKPVPEQTVLEWKAPSRPFTKKNRKYFTTIGVIGLLVALIFIFAGQGWLPAALTFSIVFLVYILSTIPPQEVTNKITTYGIRIENNLYYWDELGRFWLEKKNSVPILHIETIRFPGRIVLLLEAESEDVIREILSEVLLEQKPELTPYEKVSDWLKEKIPLDLEG
ncbi:MAG: hypothetical protein GF381_00945 [Candidatus Pacebacteria bacterium]|nr:hypothetical protein [Candidatus Paceibacterota bacterium]